MERAAAERAYNALHENTPWHDGTFKRWAQNRSPAHPYHYLDGVSIWVAATDLAPDDNFLGGGSSLPETSE